MCGARQTLCRALPCTRELLKKLNQNFTTVQSEHGRTALLFRPRPTLAAGVRRKPQVCCSLHRKAEFVLHDSLLLSFFNRNAFAPQKRILFEMFRRSRKIFRRFTTNRFNTHLCIAGRANTLYSVLTVRCSRPKNFSVEKFWSSFFKSSWGSGQRPENPRRRHPHRDVGGGAPRKHKIRAA